MAFMIWRLFFRKKQVAAFLATTWKVSLKRAARALVYLFDAHTLCLLLASAIAVYVCSVLDLKWRMDYMNSMISTGDGGGQTQARVHAFIPAHAPCLLHALPAVQALCSP